MVIVVFLLLFVVFIIGIQLLASRATKYTEIPFPIKKFGRRKND